MLPALKAAATRPTGVLHRAWARRHASTVKSVPRPRDSPVVAFRREYENEVKALRVQWRQEILAGIEKADALKEAREDQELRYLEAYRAEKDRFKAKRREEQKLQRDSFREERHTVRKQLQQHKRQVNAKTKDLRQSLVANQQKDQRGFVRDDTIASRIELTVSTAPANVNHLLPTGPSSSSSSFRRRS